MLSVYDKSLASSNNNMSNGRKDLSEEVEDECNTLPVLLLLRLLLLVVMVADICLSVAVDAAVACLTLASCTLLCPSFPSLSGQCLSLALIHSTDATAHYSEDSLNALTFFSAQDTDRAECTVRQYWSAMANKHGHSHSFLFF